MPSSQMHLIPRRWKQPPGALPTLSLPARGFVLDANLLGGEKSCQAPVSWRRTHIFLIAKTRTRLPGEGGAGNNYTELADLGWELTVTLLISSTWN